MKIRVFRTISFLAALGILTACSNSSQQVLADAQQPLASNTENVPESANAEPAPAPGGEANSAIGFAPSDTISDNNASTQLAALDNSKSFSFLPIEGAPASAAATLSKSLERSSQSQGLTILSTGRSSAKYQVKGYFSAFNDGTGTLLVYVWDVMDRNGKRLHRINGREKSSRASTNPWRAIDAQQMDRLANVTTANLKKWVDKRS